MLPKLDGRKFVCCDICIAHESFVKHSSIESSQRAEFEKWEEFDFLRLEKGVTVRQCFDENTNMTGKTFGSSGCWDAEFFMRNNLGVVKCLKSFCH